MSSFLLYEGNDMLWKNLSILLNGRGHRFESCSAHSLTPIYGIFS